MAISLKQLINENIENRVSLMRVEALLAKIAEELSQTEQEKLAEPLVELQIVVDMLNKKPHTAGNDMEWALLKMVFTGKVAELRLAVEQVADKNKKIDCCPLKDAIDLLLTY